MSPPATPAADYATVFNWSPPKSRKLSLLSFVAASVAFHALCFYIFQIIYPAAATPLPPPAHVSIITSASEEGRMLLRWIESEDPALSSTTQRPPRANAFVPPRPDYVPSYVNRQPALKDVPPFEPDLRVPSSRPPGPVALPRASVVAALAHVPTTVTFSAEADAPGAPQLPSLQFTATNNEPPQAAVFRIAISPQGEARHCLLQVSSGDRELDEQARRFLLLSRFPAIENRSATGRAKFESDLLWTTATVEWGNDIAIPLANPAEARAP